MPLRSRFPTLVAVLAAALPATASAQEPAPVDPATTGGIAASEPPPVAARVRDATFDVSARTHTLLGRTLHFRGRLLAPARRTVMVERLDPERGWVRAARARSRADGSFVARWRTDEAGRHQTRVVLVAGRRARATSASPPLAVNVLRRARATWYGPGFFGNRTACGLELTEDLVGVAHRTLPCGTRVSFHYKGATLTARVVDRGPFANGADWDFTQAAARLLDFTHTDDVGFLAAD